MDPGDGPAGMGNEAFHIGPDGKTCGLDQGQGRGAGRQGFKGGAAGSIPPGNHNRTGSNDTHRRVGICHLHLHREAAPNVLSFIIIQGAR